MLHQQEFSYNSASDKHKIFDLAVIHIYVFRIKLVIMSQVVLKLKSQLKIYSLSVETISEEKASHSTEALNFFLVFRIPKV